MTDPVEIYVASAFLVLMRMLESHGWRSICARLASADPLEALIYWAMFFCPLVNTGAAAVCVWKSLQGE